MFQIQFNSQLQAPRHPTREEYKDEENWKGSKEVIVVIAFLKALLRVHFNGNAPRQLVHRSSILGDCNVDAVQSRNPG
jgi:hypothetical protein